MKPLKLALLSLILAFPLLAMDDDWCGNSPNIDFPFLEDPETRAMMLAAEGVTNTAFDIFNELKKTEKNIIFSPFSIHASLAMTYAGAREATQTAMMKAFSYGENTATFHKGYGNLMKSLLTHGNGEKATLKISNDMWVQSGLHLEQAFLDVVAGGYNATPIEMNFAKRPEEAVLAINKKVAQDTNGEIPNLLKRLEDSTAMVLTNAVFFQAPWTHQFSEYTEAGPFTTTDGGIMATDYMRVENKFGYGEDENKQFLFMPYQGTTMSALIVLPKEGMTESYMNEMSAFDFNIMMGAMDDRRNVDVKMPTFGMRSAPRLKDVLEKLGLGILFDSQTCDLSGMNGPLSSEKLSVSDVVHQAMIEMTPQGTKAAAATATVVMRSTSIAEPQTPIEFHAIRPFDFYIVDTETGAILFMGRVMEPSSL